MSGPLDAAVNAYPSLPHLCASPLVDRLDTIASSLCDTPCPSQFGTWTRGWIVQELLKDTIRNSPHASYQANVEWSGCDMLANGDGGLRLLAHLDEISYLVATGDDRGGTRIIPYCYHLADGPRPARAVRFDRDHGFRIIAEGIIEATVDQLRFVVEHGIPPEAGDRVVPYSPYSVDRGTWRVTGSLDNALGVAAALVASETMTALGIPHSVVLTDEEEGPEGRSSQTISRGAMRVMAHLAPVPLSVVIDAHGLSKVQLGQSRRHEVRSGAAIAEFSSCGRGGVVPPYLYQAIRTVAAEVAELGVLVRENQGGYVPRSDEVSSMLADTRFCIVGYPLTNRHFDAGLPTANLRDIRDLALFLVVLGACVAAGAFDSYLPEASGT